MNDALIDRLVSWLPPSDGSNPPHAAWGARVAGGCSRPNAPVVEWRGTDRLFACHDLARSARRAETAEIYCCLVASAFRRKQSAGTQHGRISPRQVSP